MARIKKKRNQAEVDKEPLIIRRDGNRSLYEYKEKGRRRVKNLHDFSAYLPPPSRSKEYRKMMDLFFGPLFNLPSLDRLSMEERKELIFGTKHRDIIGVVSVDNFKMPGMVVNVGEWRTPTFREQNISTGTLLLVRIDERMPDRIDIEILDKDLVFHLTYYEYKSIRHFLKELCGCNEKLLFQEEIQE